GGLAIALWMRFTRRADDPAAWAWPMAVSLAAAPVIYPWYLLYFTPFLFTPATLALVAWTYTALLAYVVWYLSKYGHRWFVPVPVLWIEFGVVMLVLAAQLWLVRRETPGLKTRPGSSVQAGRRT